MEEIIKEITQKKFPRTERQIGKANRGPNKNYARTKLSPPRKEKEKIL